MFKKYQNYKLFQFNKIIQRNLIVYSHYINPSNLELTLNSIKYTNQNYDLGLFLVSKQLSITNFNTLPQLVQNALNLPHLIGGIVDGIKIKDSETKEGVCLCLIKLEAKEELVPFYWQSQHAKKLLEKSVGRWKLPEQIKHEEQTKEEELNQQNWEGYQSISQAFNSLSLPKVLQDVKDEEDNFMFLLGDKESLQYLETLDSHFLKSKKLGLIAASTQFLNNQSSTLYYKQNIYNKGLLGFLINRSTNFNMKINYPTLKPISRTLTISKCKGNILLELEEGNPTLQLLEAIELNLIKKDKEVEFFLQVQDKDRKDEARYFKILSGDPKKGTMSIETLMDLKIGSKVKFYKYDKSLLSNYNQQASLTTTATNNSNLNLQYIDLEENYYYNDGLSNHIISENGLIYSNKVTNLLSSRNLIMVPYSSIGLKWS